MEEWRLRDILHAQAYGQFTFADGSHGNMIVIKAALQNSDAI